MQVVEVQAGNWSVHAWGGGAREGEHDALGDVVEGSVGFEADGLPFFGSEDPVAHVVDRCISSRGGGGGLSEFDDLSSTLLHARGEFVGEPGGVNEGWGLDTSDSSVSDIGVHGW